MYMVYCLLFIVYCLLFIVYCLLFIVYNFILSIKRYSRSGLELLLPQSIIATMRGDVFLDGELWYSLFIFIFYHLSFYHLLIDNLNVTLLF